MKKNLIYLLALLFIGTFTACHDDDNNPTPTPIPEPTPKPTPIEVVEGLYTTNLIFDNGTNKDTTEVTLSFTKTNGENLLKLQVVERLDIIGYLNIDSVVITEKDGNPYFEVVNKEMSLSMGDTKVNLNGSVIDKEIKLHMTLAGTDKNYTLDFTGSAVKNNVAAIYGITIESDIILLQPELSGKDFTFYIKGDATSDQLKLTPQYSLAKGALINPEVGQSIDFSDAVANGEAVKINVVSEDFSKQKTYNLYCKKLADVNNSFEKWVKGVEDQEPEMTFYEVANGWSSSNTGAQFLKAFNSTPGMFVDSVNLNYNVVQVTDPQEGEYAAKIITLNTLLGPTGEDAGLGALVPGITSGTLFLGSFNTNMGNTLLSTKFGVPYFQKPLHFTGHYKYAPGTTYYVTTGDGYTKECKPDNSKTDAPAINAVLYEVSNYNMTSGYYSEALTGVDVFSSPKLVARAELKDTDAHADYTSFDLEFEYKYGKTFDPNKKYMLAIIFASSKEGDKFCGAPGSTLIVDNIQIIAE